MCIMCQQLCSLKLRNLEATNELKYLLQMNLKEDKKVVAEQKTALIMDIIGIEFEDPLVKKKLPTRHP